MFHFIEQFFFIGLYLAGGLFLWLFTFALIAGILKRLFKEKK